MELAEAVAALQAELAQAVAAGREAEFAFPVTGVQLEFHVGITKTGGARAGVRFEVVELGSGGYAQEQIHTVTVTLGAPADRTGGAVMIEGPSPGPPFDDDE